MLLGQAVNLATATGGAVLSMAGYERALRRNAVISTLACLACAALLIPFFGGIGASIAIAVALGLQSVLAVVVVRRRMGLNLIPALPALQGRGAP